MKQLAVGMLIVIIMCMAIDKIDIAKDYGETETIKHSPCNCGPSIRVDTGFVYDYRLNPDSSTELIAYPKNHWQIIKIK